MLILLGQFFVLGFAFGIAKPMADHAENEAKYWNGIADRYEGSGSR